MEVSFVDQLRARRAAKHINQTELGKAAGVSRNYISMIERGEIENVSFDVLRRLCHALELEFSYQVRPYESFQDFVSNRADFAYVCDCVGARWTADNVGKQCNACHSTIQKRLGR